MPNWLRRLALGANFAILALFLTSAAAADIFNVMDPQFDPYARANIDHRDRAFDDARRFRLAYAAAARAGGGTIYVPAGTMLRFESIDPADGQADSHVFIRHPAIRVLGDSRGGGPAGPDHGSVITSLSTNLTLFKIGFTTSDPLFNRGSSANGTSFENLHLTRHPELEDGSKPTLAATANGIAIDTIGQVEAFIYRTSITNCRVENQHTGLRSFRRGAKRAARPTYLTIQQCEFSDNQSDGVMLQDWGSIVVVASFFQANGRDGIRAFAYRPLWGGTMNITASGFANNGEFGLRLRKYSTYDNGADWVPRDVHIAACQFDYNGAGAINARSIGNINISACSITANTRNPRFADQPAAEFVQCTQLAISGTTFDGNNASALRLSDLWAASISGCNFTWNNNNAISGTAGQHPAVVIDGGRQVVFGACAFAGGRLGRQQYGVMFTGAPRGVMLTGLSFEEGTTDPIMVNTKDRLRQVRVEYMTPNGDAAVFTGAPIATSGSNLP